MFVMSRQRRHDVRGVEPAAEAGFPHHKIHLLLREIPQRQHGGELEERRLHAAKQHLQLGDMTREVRVADGHAVDLDAFAETHQMR